MLSMSPLLAPISSICKMVTYSGHRVVWKNCCRPSLWVRVRSRIHINTLVLVAPRPHLVQNPTCLHRDSPPVSGSSRLRQCLEAGEWKGLLEDSPLAS